MLQDMLFQPVTPVLSPSIYVVAIALSRKVYSLEDEKRWRPSALSLVVSLALLLKIYALILI